MADNQEKMVEHLASLDRRIARQNSLKHMFAAGVFYGFGVFVGSAILAGLLLAAWAWTVKHVPGLGDIVSDYFVPKQ